MNKDYRAGFVSIVGKPNVGKSTLMNKLLGEKLSIISPKPQTTRQQIKGIISDEKRQIILMDTPGFVEARYTLHTKMLEYINNSLNDSDIVIFMTDAKKFPTDYDKQVCNNLQKLSVPKIALLNKIDLSNNEVVKEVVLFENLHPTCLAQSYLGAAKCYIRCRTSRPASQRSIDLSTV